MEEKGVLKNSSSESCQVKFAVKSMKNTYEEVQFYERCRLDSFFEDFLSVLVSSNFSWVCWKPHKLSK